jgi:class 3 adenylate cyclase
MTVERFPIPFPTLNPLARPELAVTGWVITLVAGAMYAAALGIILVGVVQRFRRSRGIERQQLKWFAYGASIVGSAHGSLAILLIVLYLTMGKGFLDAPPTALRAWVLGDIAAFAAPPVAVAFAILRYRLYDIDILINRTVLYVSVTAILAAAFAILSTASQRAMEAITGQRSDTLSIALALALALGFAPLCRRIQPLVDQALPGRGVLTLLFTDIVGSTERIVALGDDRWRSVLDAYRAAVRRELTRFGGREVDTAGDGFFATFERPTQAVRCAGALRESLHDIGLDSRIGLHTGECEMRGERVSGLNVVVAARIMATARANEIVASSAVCELVGGSGFRCRDGRVESLKGVPGEWRLHFVDAPVAMAR